MGKSRSLHHVEGEGQGSAPVGFRKPEGVGVDVQRRASAGPTAGGVEVRRGQACGGGLPASRPYQPASAGIDVAGRWGRLGGEDGAVEDGGAGCRRGTRAAGHAWA
jgi:hypothetical protein